MISALGSMNVYPLLLLILGLLQAMNSDAKSSNPQCVTSSCGDIRDIHRPFRLKSDPKGCGDSNFELACEDNRTVAYLVDNRYYVQSINYSDYRIRLVDDGLQKDNCSSLPHHSLVIRNSYFDTNMSFDIHIKDIFVIVNCSKLISSPFYISTRPCIEGSYSSNASSNWNLYALVNPNASDVRDFCTISSWAWVSRVLGPDKQVNISSYSYELIHNSMAEGFDLSVYDISKTFFCYLDFYIYFHFHNSFFYKYYGWRRQVCGSKYYFGGEHWLAMKFYPNVA